MNLKPIFARIVVISFFLSLWLIPQAVRGQTLYWDLPGGANPSPSGPWDTTSANWSANPNGGGQTTWANGSNAFFSANELAATDNYTITLATNVTVGDLTYTGGNIGASTLQIAVGAGNTITMQNPVMNVAVDGGTILVIAPVIAGAGNLNLTGGTLVLTGANTYIGGTTITTASLQIGNGGTTGSILGDVTDNSNLTFDRSDNITFSSNISGTGNVTQNGTGTVTLTGVNSYSGGTVVFGGIPGAVGGKLSVASDGELGDPAGGITMNGGELLTTTDGFSTARAITVGSTSALSTLAAATGTTATYTGLLSGPGGSLTIGDAINKGTVVFTGNNSYSGITTIFAGVTLQLGIGGTTGSIVGTSITDRGILAFDRSDPITFAVPVSGAGLSGSISQIGSGTLTLTGANTYRGGTSVSGNGTISVATDANLGATTGTLGGVTLQSGELLTTGTAFNTARGITLSAALGDDTLAAATGTTATYTGVVSGVGGLTVGDGTNTGTIVLTGTNTYSFGNTLIRAATTLQIGNGGATGSILGNVVDNGTFGFNRTDAVTFSGAVSGTGALSQIGPGTLTLTNVANGYSGGTFVLGGTLSVDTDAELGLTTGGITLQGGELLTTTDGFTTARTVDVSPTGTPNTLAATTGTTATYSGLISDTGALVIGDATHTGTVVFTGNNTYSGGTTITSGTLQLGDGVTNGSITGNVTDNGTFAFNPNGSVTFGGAISGAGNMAKLGAGTVILTANNSYTGTTTISGGTLQIGNGGTSGSIVGNVTDNGNLDFDRSDVVTLPGDTSGTGSLSQTGSGTLILTGANSYNGGTTISAGTLQVGNGGATGSIVGDVTNNGVLVFDRTGTVSFAGAVSGAGTLNQVGPGTLVLTGTSNYAGATTVSAGNLEVDGVLQNTAVSVQTGAVLSGKGTIVGGVTIQNGGHLAPGPGAQTLGVGNLSLSSGSILDYVLSTPGVIGGGVNTLVNVGGNLTLAGILNVTNGGSFGAGTYRLINYTGALSGTTLSLGTLPAGFTEVVTTAVPDQVNLVVSASGGPTQFWNGGTTAGDGTVHGGNGTWDNFTTNFTNAGGTASQSWQNGFAIFSVTPGPVTLGDNILFQRMEFTVSGYTVAGAGSFTLTATGAAVITSDPGVSATISAPIGGVSGLTKSGSGELTLSGTNTYSGGTTVLAGVLSVRSDTNLGNVNGGITLEGGELVTTIDGFTTARTVDVNGSGSPDTLAAAVGTTATYSGVLSDTGALVVGDPTNVGTVVLTGANTYSGGTSLNGGILAVSNDGNLGTGPLNFNGGTLEALTGGGGITSSKAITLFGNGGTFLADAGTQSTFSAAITGNGNFTISGAGELFLTATNNYTGTTTISGATLLIGNGGVTGSIVGNVVDNGTLAFNRSDNITFGGVISGAGVLEQIGPGTLILTGTNSYNGGTMVVNNSVLRVDNDGELGGPAGGITLQGGELETSADFTSARAISTLVPTVAGANILGASVNTTATYSGLISGGGGLVVGGPGDTGTVVLSGANTYTGGTTLSAGATLSVANDGNLGDSSGGLTLNGGELLATGNSFSTARAITVNNGILAAAPGGFAEISGNITVNGGLTIGDAVNSGVVAFSGTNTYGGTTTIVGGATLRADTATGFSPNSAFSVNGTLDLRGSLSQVGSLSGTGLVTNQSGQGAVLTAGSDNSSTTFSGAIQDGGFALGLTKTGSGTLILSGTSTYTGATSVSVGTLQVDGALGNTAVSVESGAVLAGHGTIAGDVTIQNGGHLAPGPVAETLGVRNLVLNQNSILDYVLSTPGVVGGVNTLVNVTGNLTLDGTLNVTNGGSFGAGAYRLLNYTGALTDNTLELGTLPAGFSEVVTTGVPNQVNLVVTSSSVASQFWDGSNTLFDGTVHGGTGTWDNVTTNFTDAGVTVNQAWQGGMAIFSAAGGTVTLGDNIGFHGIQFTIDGYTIVGAGGFTLVPTGTAVISTDAGVSATISASISGTGGLDKAGLGSLTVSGDNTYTGGTTVSGGILSVATDANLGDTTGSLELNGGELLTTGSFTSARTVTLTPGGSPNILAALASTIGTYTGVISGSGGLTVGETIHTGTVVLTNANNSYTGGTTISGTTLSVAVDGNLGDSSGGIALDGGELVATGTGFTTFRPVSLMPNGGVLAAGAAGLADFEGNITGSGNLTIGDVVNTGTVNFSGINSYTGSTTITSGVTLKALSTSAFSSASSFTVSGTLDLNGFNNEVESLSGAGTVTNGGGNAAVFTVGGNGPSTFSGVLQNGASLLGLNKVDPGTLVLTGSNTYTGGTTITAGNLQVGNGGITGSITGNVTDNSAITFSRSDVVTFSGNISGSGSLVQAGAGTLILTGTNVYGGITTIIGGGTLQLGNGGATGSITGNVSDSGSLVFDSSTPLIFGGAIQGPGSVTVMDGLLTLTAGNTYAGDNNQCGNTTAAWQ